MKAEMAQHGSACREALLQRRVTHHNGTGVTGVGERDKLLITIIIGIKVAQV
jgi:hypothetical protein